MSSTKKIFFLIPPALGHINPVLGLVNELVKLNHTVIFYGNETHREIIEKTGAQFRLYSHPTLDTIETKPIHEQDPNDMLEMFSKLIDSNYELLPSLLADTEKELPDMIVYDQIMATGKYLVKILKKKKNFKQPHYVMSLPSFALNSEIIKTIMRKVNFMRPTTLAKISVICFKQLKLGLGFGMGFVNPFDISIEKSDTLNLVAVFPELQPMRETFDDTYKFVGPCISEKVRNCEITDVKLKEIMAEFKPNNSELLNLDHEPNARLKLIYVSLGSVNHVNVKIYEIILEALKRFDEKSRKIKLGSLKVVVSLGDKSLQVFQSKIANEGYTLPENILLFAKVPQIELLKRASLFITHAGQNSTSETIQYGVPVIAIPLVGDQILCANRMCADLGLGIQFDAMKLEVGELADAIENVLTTEF
jgi:UDP:flavonoid glycosyltransferase YjiC (YdhE family)